MNHRDTSGSESPRIAHGRPAHPSQMTSKDARQRQPNELDISTPAKRVQPPVRRTVMPNTFAYWAYRR